MAFVHPSRMALVPKDSPLFPPLVLVFRLHMPPRRIHDHQVPIEGVTGAWIATQGVAGTKNTMANVNEADATVVAKET
jgi:hypothetical protein